MNYIFVGKNLVVSQAMKEQTEKKIRRISKLFTEDTSVHVSFSAVKADNKVEVSIPLNKRMIRAEVTASDMYAAIDEAVDILERQMIKYKNRLKDKSRRDTSFKDELSSVFAPEVPAAFEEEVVTVERMKHFPLKPMDPEEAVMEMEMLGHNFFVFRNSDTSDINVVYKRHKGYGLIDPNDPIDAYE